MAEVTCPSCGAPLVAVLRRAWCSSNCGWKYPRPTPQPTAPRLAALALVLLGCHGPGVLNPDPVHGGQCHNGDQLAVMCDNGYCCPDGTQCPSDHGPGCEGVPPVVPGPFGDKLRDGGHEAGR